MGLPDEGNPISLKDFNDEVGSGSTSTVDLRAASAHYGLSTPDGLNELYFSTYYQLISCDDAGTHYTKIVPPVASQRYRKTFPSESYYWNNNSIRQRSSLPPPSGYDLGINLWPGETGCFTPPPPPPPPPPPTPPPPRPPPPTPPPPNPI